MSETMRDITTHGTTWLSSRSPPCRAGHTRGHRQRRCHRSRHSPQWTHKSRCHRCKHPGMAQDPPAREPQGGLGLGPDSLAPGLGRSVLVVRVGERGSRVAEEMQVSGSNEGMDKKAEFPSFSSVFQQEMLNKALLPALHRIDVPKNFSKEHSFLFICLPAQSPIHPHNLLPTSWVLRYFYIDTNTHTHTC